MSKIGGLKTKGIEKISKDREPLISIITVVYNGEKHIEQTINSVLNQTYNNIEYIIIDGDSTDGTLNIIERYEDQIDYYISEPDGGISDAFNKGIALARGEWIGLINADDWYEPDSCQTVAKHNEYDFLFGTVRYWDGERSYTDRAKPEIISEDMRINHPTLFVKRQLYEELGVYDKSLKLAMDYDLVLRLFRANKRYINIERIMANMRTEGISQQFWVKSKIEAKEVKIRHGVPKYEASKYLMTIRFKRYILDLLKRYNLSFLHRAYQNIFKKNPKFHQ